MSTELAWAAGFFDGEGNVNYSTPERRRPRIMVQVSQVERAPLDRFLEAVKLGTITGPYQPKALRHSPYFRWYVEGYEAAQSMFWALGSYLCEIKRADFERSLTNYADWLENPLCWRGTHAPMRQGKRGRFYCAECKQEAGRIGGSQPRCA